MANGQVGNLCRAFITSCYVCFYHFIVVTGCTRGIGLGYVHALAKRGMDIIMIGRDGSRLEPSAAQISMFAYSTVEYMLMIFLKIGSEYGVKVEIIEADFAFGKEIYGNLREKLKDKDIGVLVNNVGIFLEYPMYFTEVR